MSYDNSDVGLGIDNPAAEAIEEAQAALSSVYRADNMGLDSRLHACAEKLSDVDYRRDHLWDVIARLQTLVAELEVECGI